MPRILLEITKNATASIFCAVASTSFAFSASLTSGAGTSASIANPAQPPMARQMVDQHMQEFPEPWMMRKSDGAYRWSYVPGLVLLGTEQFFHLTDDDAYAEYIQQYADRYVHTDGRIDTYSITEFNIDSINAGRMLFFLYDQTGDERYRAAMDQLRLQLDHHPRTKSGGFWHKRKYPWQIWLDGLYMAHPFYAEYEKRYGSEPAVFNDIVSQFTTLERITRDPKTGLLYHGWDESRLQAWADPKTGLSQGFWSRAMGWYAMALVDTYPHLPADHPGRAELSNILQRLTTALERVQDQESGLWYQVPDQGAREGNWLEASGSSMFVYAIAKGVRLGMLPDDKLPIAKHGYQGIMDRLVYRDQQGQVHIRDVCRSAGLGGTPYRDGSYSYYVSTDRVEDDGHGRGAFFLAASEAARW